MVGNKRKERKNYTTSSISSVRQPKIKHQRDNRKGCLGNNYALEYMKSNLDAAKIKIMVMLFCCFLNETIEEKE